MTNGLYRQVIDALAEAGTVLLCTHLQPDGDAIGSMLALNEYLHNNGKQTLMVCHDLPPANLQFLPGVENIRLARDAAPGGYDLALSVDASDADRLGDAGKLFSVANRTVQIDHHQTNTMFAGINLVDTVASSSGTIICRLYEAAGMSFSRNAAINLYTAISTDTGNFCYGNITAELFDQMAALMRAGLPIVRTAYNLHLLTTREQTMLLGRALYSLTFLEDGRLTCMRLTREDFEACGATTEHAERIVNHGLNIAGVQLTFLATQVADGIKFSLRSLAPYDVSQVAARFGGGGHMYAAGCTIREPMDAAVEKMKQAMASVLHDQRHR